MPQPFQNKQIRIVPHLGQNNQSIELGIDTNEAFRLDDADYSTSKEGAVKKRHPTHKIVQIFTTPIYIKQLYLLRLFDFIFKYTVTLNEQGQLVDPKLHWAPIPYLQHHAGEWYDFPIPPQNHIYRGVELHSVPNQILSDPRIYLSHQNPALDVLDNDMYMYLFDDIKLEGQFSGNQILWTRRSDDEVAGTSVYYTSVLPFRNWRSQLNYLPWDITLEEDDDGIYLPGQSRQYRFIYEDTTGSRLDMQDFLLTNNNTYRCRAKFTPHVSGAYDIKRFLPGLSRIWIFRTTTHIPDPPIGDELAYNIFADSSQGFRSYQWNASIYDNILDTNLQDNALMSTYYLGGIHPKLHRPPQATLGGEFHQGRLYTWLGEDMFWSMSGRPRVFFESNNINFPDAGQLMGARSLGNSLLIFGENDIYLWRGLSAAQMDAIRPVPIFGQGIKSARLRNIKGEDISWSNTIQRFGDKVFFIDKEGYARMIIGNKVIYLSTDGKKKINIPGNRLDSAIINNSYRITDREYEYVCFLGGKPPYKWTRWRNNVRKYMYPRYNNLLDRIDYIE